MSDIKRTLNTDGNLTFHEGLFVTFFRTEHVVATLVKFLYCLLFLMSVLFPVFGRLARDGRSISKTERSNAVAT